MENRTISQQLDDLAGYVCDELCRFNKEVNEKYADDADAQDKALEHYCNKCRLGEWI